MNNKDFGEYLKDLREKNGFDYIDLEEKMQMPEITIKNLRKWERDLEYPNIDVIYKLSEIYGISSTELLTCKEFTLKSGVGKINKRFIRYLSYILNISIYSTIWGSRLFFAIALIGSLMFFCAKARVN